MNTRLTGRPASAVPGVQSHIGERAFDRRAPAGIGSGGGIGHAAGNAEHLARVGAPGDLRLERRAIERDLAVELGVVVALERAPMRQRRDPTCAPCGA